MTEFCTVAPNVCGSSVRNWLYLALPARRTLTWLLVPWREHISLSESSKVEITTG